MQEYNICYSLDSNYAEQLAVSIASILKNADISDNINFYILDDGLSADDKNKINLLQNIKKFNIEYISVLNDDFKACPLLTEKDEKYKDYHVTLPTYFRFKLPKFLPKLDKILYLDCDVIVRTSLKDLFSIPLDNTATAMVLDADTEKESKRLSLEKYFNAGVMLINLGYWRKNNIGNKLFEYAQNNKEHILWQDQDIVNIVLKDEIKKIDKKWNYQYFQYEELNNDELADSSILHIAGRFKPWLMPFESNVYDEYYCYLSFTAWKNNIVKYKQNSFGKHLKNQIGGSVTNILVDATDEDIQKVYKDVAQNYNEIQNIYDAIAKSNEFVKELDKEARYLLEKQTNEKITGVYEEITRNYKYTKKLVDEVKTENSNSKTLLENFIE
ncbi:MAG: glycosyltransferase family 8 protein [Candidatus Gastranaerophilales bacterium]|nr:glycosyltransferase family 8 protein [Candidatus Gastranaerophilales bacterium]